MDIEVKEKKELKENMITEKIRLDKAYINYHNIIDKKLPYKFAYLDEWLLKNSKLLLSETMEYDNQATKTYKTYKRGTIIKVDFGVNLGSEMSQVHFAIVLNNYDNPKNNVLTVIPLTSKESRFNLDLENLVMDKLIEKIKKELLKIGIKEELDFKDRTLTIEEQIKLKKLYNVLDYYRSNQKNTYACSSLITTISKTRIFKPINEYDFVGKERCSKEVMDKIDKELIEKFTKNI